MPNANPNTSQWIWFALSKLELGLRWACTFHVVCVNFVRIGTLFFFVEYGFNSIDLVQLVSCGPLLVITTRKPHGYQMIQTLN